MKRNNDASSVCLSLSFCCLFFFLSALNVSTRWPRWLVSGGGVSVMKVVLRRSSVWAYVGDLKRRRWMAKLSLLNASSFQDEKKKKWSRSKLEVFKHSLTALFPLQADYLQLAWNDIPFSTGWAATLAHTKRIGALKCSSILSDL